MADLFFSPAIIPTGGTEPFWLPPWIVMRVTRGQSVEMIPLAQQNEAVIASVFRNQGAKIELTLSGIVPDELSAESVLRWIEEVFENCSGEDKTFTFFLFNDRGWPGCALESQSEEIGLEPLIVLKNMGLSIVCPVTQPDTNLQITFTDYDTEYPYAALVGRPLGVAAVPGEAVEVVQKSIQNPTGIFVGQASAATTAGQEQRFIVGGSVGSQWKLEALKIVSADPFDAPTATDIRISTGQAGAGAPNIQASVAGLTGYSGNEVTGNITVTAGDTLYCFIQTAGGHTNVHYQARLRAI